MSLGWDAYLSHNQMYVLPTTLLLIAYSPVLNLRASPQTRLDIRFQRHILHGALAARIKCLALDRHLLGRTAHQLLQRQRQLLLHDRRLGRGRALRRLLESARPATIPEVPTAAEPTSQHREDIVIIHTAAHTTTHTAHAAFGKVPEDIVCIAEPEPAAAAAGTSREVECPGTATAAARHAAEREAAGHATFEGVGAVGTTAAAGRRGTATKEIFEAELVINFSFFRVGKNLVCLGHLC